jgi:hypothetical protein
MHQVLEFLLFRFSGSLGGIDMLQRFSGMFLDGGGIADRMGSLLGVFQGLIGVAGSSRQLGKRQQHSQHQQVWA